MSSPPVGPKPDSRIGFFDNTANLLMTCGAVFALLLVLWSGNLEWRNFIDHQQSLIATEGASVTEAVSRFVGERSRLLALFAKQNRDQLSRYLRSDDDPDQRAALKQLIGQTFPDHFAFTLRSEQGDLFPDEFGRFVGEVCRRDIEAFWDYQVSDDRSANDYRPFIHPQANAYHFDMMEAWETTDDKKALLFISFYPTQITQLITDFQLPNHRVILVRQDQRDLIEITAKGARDTLGGTIRLTAADRMALQAERAVAKTQWVALIGLETAFYSRKQEEVFLKICGLMVSVVLFWGLGIAMLAGSRRQTEAAFKALRAETGRLQNSQRIARIGSWEWDLLSDRHKWTDEVYRILDVPVSKDRSPTLDSLKNRLQERDREPFLAALQRALSGQRALDEEVAIRRHGGAEGYLHIRANITFGANGKPLKLAGAIHDVTERVQLDRAKAIFISAVNHELRTPLTSIKGSLSLMDAGAMGRLPDKARTLIQIAHRNVDRLIDLVGDILNIEKLQSGEMAYRLEKVHLPSLLEEAVLVNEGYATGFKTNLVIKGDVPDLDLLCDRGRILQVLTNLISNAIKFSPENSEVHVSAVREDRFIRLSVQDHGKGISENFRSRVFERFAQEIPSGESGRVGTGLGLAICKSIVEGHGGTITFETWTGKGTIFHFALPLYEEWVEALRA